MTSSLNPPHLLRRPPPLPSMAAATSATSPFLPPTPQRRISALYHTTYFAYPLNHSSNSKTVTTAPPSPATRTRNAIASAVSGPTSAQSAFDEETEDLLDEVQVFGLDGDAVPITDLWKDRRAVVAFARHFGCVLCRKRADYLAAKKDVMDASGVALVLIGPGSIEQARTFAEQTKFKGEVYADPNHSSYEALRFISGVATTFTPGAGLKIIQSYMEGYRQDWNLSFERDTVSRGGWQQGGIVVAGPGKGNVSYIHKDKEAGDDPDIQEIIHACCS